MPRRRQTQSRPAGAANGNHPNHEQQQQQQQHHHHHHHYTHYQNDEHNPHHNPHHHHHHRPQRANRNCNTDNNNNNNNNYANSNANAQDAAEAAAAAAVVAYRNDTRSSLNLPVIARHVPNVKRVVCQAAYCTVYKISATSGQWDKPDIEGPLFVLEVATDDDKNEEEEEYSSSSSSSNNDDEDVKEKQQQQKLGKYQIFIMNRKGICSLLIPLPKKPANLDTGSSELISILVDEATKGGGKAAAADGSGKMKFDASDEKGKSVECYGLRIYSEEGTSTAGDMRKIEEELQALVNELKEEELLAARRAEEAAAEKEQQRNLKKEMEAAARQQQQQQQQHAHGMVRSASSFRDVGGSSYRETSNVGRRITLAELFGGGGGSTTGGGSGQMQSYSGEEYSDHPPGPMPMSYSYTHM